jgi:hypothetical protein
MLKQKGKHEGSPDPNPIEMAFAKLNALLRKAAARTYGELWKAVGPSATSSPRTSASTTSSQQDTNPNERDTL